jgi:DNA-binding NarL/FixJ family response regulator
MTTDDMDPRPTGDAGAGTTGPADTTGVIPVADARPTVMIVGAQDMLIDALAQALQTSGNVNVIGSVEADDTAAVAIGVGQPDVVILDASQSTTNLSRLVARLKTAHPALGVLALGTDPEPTLVANLLAAGACGFLLKSQSLDALIAAIGEAHAKRPVIAPELMGTMLDHLAARARVPVLTERHRQILELLALGTDTKHMAAHFRVTVNTMRKQVRSLLLRLDAHSKLEAVAIGHRSGLITMPAPQAPGREMMAAPR